MIEINFPVTNDGVNIIDSGRVLNVIAVKSYQAEIVSLVEYEDSNYYLKYYRYDGNATLISQAEYDAFEV